MERRRSVTGRIGEKSITRYIYNHQPVIPEQMLTIKKQIRELFEAEGYNSNQVIFDND